MLKRSRVGTSLDTARLGNALAGPGMDTRIWSSLAVVKGVSIDHAEGVFADVLLMPSQTHGTARLGSEYAGNGFGMYTPVEVDDEVLVEAPSGDPNEGLVITRRMHSPSDPPPHEVPDKPKDVLLFIRSGSSVRLITIGGGNIIIESRDDGQVLLGNEAAELGVGRLEDYVKTNLTALQAMLDLRYAQIPPAGPLPMTLTAAAAAAAITEADPNIALGRLSQIDTASDKVKST